MDVKMGNGAVSLGDALFPLFPCLWVSLCNSKCLQEGALPPLFLREPPGLPFTLGMQKQHPLGNVLCIARTGLLPGAEACSVWQILLLTCFLYNLVLHIQRACVATGPSIVYPHPTHRPTRCPSRRFWAIQLGSLVCALSLFFLLSSFE